MLSFRKLLQPKTIDEAVAFMDTYKNAPLLAGGCWLRLGQGTIPTLIDLSLLNLRYVREEGIEFVIGAMATERDVETFPAFKTFHNGILVKSVASILGVQFRNMATMGASVASRYGFSDMIPTLLALKADVVLARMGRMSLQEYMDYRGRDLLVEIRIPKINCAVAMETMRKSASDFPYLTGAIRRDEDGFAIYIGCRPAKATYAELASAILNEKDVAGIDEVAEIVGKELKYSSNSHASKEYRKAMVVGMTRRLIEEVVVAWN